MQANAKPAAAPGDGAPASEDPALIQISNQHTKLSQARSEEPAPTKLNDQRNTHAMPVRAQWLPRSPLGRGVLGRGVNREPCSQQQTPRARETAIDLQSPWHRDFCCCALGYHPSLRYQPSPGCHANLRCASLWPA